MPDLADLRATAKQHFERSEYAESLACCERLIQAEPENAVNWLKAADNLQYLGRYDESLQYCDRAITLDPKNPLAFICKASGLMKLERLDEVICNCGAAMELSPRLDETFAYRGIAFAGKGLQELCLHVEYLDRGSDAAQIRASAARAISEFKRAIADLSLVKEDNDRERSLISSLADTISLLDGSQTSRRSLEGQLQTLESTVGKAATSV